MTLSAAPTARSGRARAALTASSGGLPERVLVVLAMAGRGGLGDGHGVARWAAAARMARTIPV